MAIKKVRYKNPNWIWDRSTIEPWMEALKSGDYDKGRGQLVKDQDNHPKHCCLGVYYEEGLGDASFTSYAEFLDDGFIDVEYQTYLARFNDGKYSHAEIAEAIKTIDEEGILIDPNLACSANSRFIVED